MPRVRSTHVEVYVFRRRGAVEFLALRRAADRRLLPGVWQPVTGKRRPVERALDAAVREVREETGLVPRRWWALETLTAFFEPGTDSILLLPLFAAEVGPGAAVRLSREHDRYRFLSAREAGRRYLWAAQRRALDAVRAEVLGGGALARALEVTALASPRRPRAALVPGRRQR